MRPKSDINQLMYADCRLCSDMDKNNAVLCKFHSPVSISAKYMHRKRMFYMCLPCIFGTARLFMYIQMHNLLWCSASVSLSVIHGERKPPLYACIEELCHRIKISNRRATQRCNVSAFFYAKICSLLARRRSSQPVQRVYWPENVIDWLGKWRPTCVMRHARGQKLQSFRRKWPFYMNLYSMVMRTLVACFQAFRYTFKFTNLIF